MNVHKQAIVIYSALKDNATAEAAIRAELEALALQIVTDPSAAFDITSSTVNGKSYAGSRSMTNQDRLNLLNLVVAMYDAGGVISSKATPVF